MISQFSPNQRSDSLEVENDVDMGATRSFKIEYLISKYPVPIALFKVYSTALTLSYRSK
jgi:hypothetical protein